MSFATSIALLVGLLAALPVMAHLLRRGKTEEVAFPPAKLVPHKTVTSAQRKRLEDRLLLALRAAMVVGLSVLGATPFVRCSRLSVDRPTGGSVALALVVDNSESMRARSDASRSRFDEAMSGARELVASLRDGDAVAIVSAGTPATVLLGATTDIALVKRTLSALSVTDSATDLASALDLGQAALRELPHTEKRLVLLSDLAAEGSVDASNVWTPLTALTRELANCGIAAAEQRGAGIAVSLACNSASAAAGRSVELVTERDSNLLARLPLARSAGEQLLTLDNKNTTETLRVRLSPAEPSGKDSIPEDDQATVSSRAAGLRALVFTNAAHRAVATGGAAITEQALQAIDETLDVHPSAIVPETAKDLEDYALFVLDDPTGFTPEARAAVSEWVNKGGVLLGLLGPGASALELSASIEPFARDGISWEKATDAKLDVHSLAWLGEEAQSLENLGPTGRVRLDASDLAGAQVLARWSDGVPWIFRRSQGRGAILTVGLPAALENTEFPLRAGFLALLSHALDEARRGQGPGSSQVGTTWRFRAGDEPSIVPPGPSAKTIAAKDLATQNGEKQFTPQRSGRYELVYGNRREQRVVTVDPQELSEPAGRFRVSQPKEQQGGRAGQVNASSEWALLVLGLFALELVARLLRGGLLKRRAARVAA